MKRSEGRVHGRLIISWPRSLAIPSPLSHHFHLSSQQAKIDGQTEIGDGEFPGFQCIFVEMCPSTVSGGLRAMITC